MALTIPESLKRGLLLIQGMPPEGFESLELALSSMKPALFDQDAIDQLRAVPGVLEAQDVRRVVETVLGLHAARIGLSQDAGALVSDLLVATNASEFLQDADRLRERLMRLLDIDSVRISAKALNLFSDSQTHFVSARILTDLRPVFDDDAKNEPIAAVVTHTLKIEYHDASRRNELYLHVSSDDLASLRSALDRALVKQTAVLSLALRANVPVIESVRDDQNA